MNDGIGEKAYKLAKHILNKVNPCCRVYHNVAQSVATATLTPVAFNQELFDTDTIHDTSTNNTRLTCKTAGIYQISGQVEFAIQSGGIRSVHIRLNGITYIARVMVAADASNTPRINITTMYQLAVNDYVELLVYQDSGSSVNVNSTSRNSPDFMMAKVG